MPAPSLIGDVLVIGLFPTALCTTIATDLARRVIPNLVVLALLAGFALLAAIHGVPDLKLRLYLAAGVLGVGFLLFSADVIGAGDAKLAAAVVPWLDPGQVPAFLLLCGLLGAGLVAATLWRHRLQRLRLSALPALPYGVALAGAALLLFPFSTLMGAA
ncbi:prepilin peptidase [Aquabacter sp. L1I39]|uniref:prepilin peptidase n=1 Tax=Aquabacter sp. L1I39 TaxID=2820278 RepID=UPI001ADA136D|nr:prepilin peptidase [Aquabacter sp. L1I39]QTL02942.1 prepilin peptidase [Aquabacter sp. L1I39]